MSLSYGDTKDTLANRKSFLSGLKIDYRDLVCAKQGHGGNVRYAGEADRGRGALSYDTAIADTDALITDKKNLALAVFTADCLPIFLYAPRNSAIGLIHAGWRGTQKGIAARAVEAISERFGIRAEDLSAGLGPAIRQCCYEVSEEFRVSFPDGIIIRKGRYYLDLVGVNKRQLLDCGVKEANIFDCGFCTSCCNKEFFSYRKEGKSCGRMMSVIMQNA